MQDLGGIGPAIVIALLIVVMLWFTLGTQRNIRKGNHLLVWLQEDLPRIGPRTTLRWLGSSAVELTIVEPREPFRTATVVLVLEPRDVGGRRASVPMSAIHTAGPVASTTTTVTYVEQSGRTVPWPSSMPGRTMAWCARRGGSWPRRPVGSGGSRSSRSCPTSRSTSVRLPSPKGRPSPW
jgi:hypothetical protein